ncbi:MAG: nucleoside triphosphate pyrophosphohydrolase [Oscillospiraceae bacterium]|nr:nucleoside triphosphate pyrophosphohydrolase [Oscillospiraceae bacterium]
MESAGFVFDSVPAEIEETIPPGSSPQEAVMVLARQKARKVASAYPNAIVVGADTLVVIDGEFLGKPADKAEAFAMLKRLSGKRHCVFTGVSVIDKNDNSLEMTFCEETAVTFHDLNDVEINAYIETGEPFDKAGAYGIQGRGMLLVKSIEGDFYNVMGLPISRLSRFLNSKIYPRYDVGDLLKIMSQLRRECPWDKEQTHVSIRSNVIEEAYEVAEAIDSGNPKLLCEELGDLLLQVVFHAEIAGETDSFDFTDVCAGICKKLIYRHPHVFESVKADSTEEVLKNWEELKSESKEEQTVTERLLSVPKSLPALMRGEKVGKKAGMVGFDFTDVNETLEGLKSEIAELELAIMHKDEAQIAEEFGDILLSCCNVGRFLKKDSEKALTFAINKFIMRFKRLEDTLLKSGENFERLREKLRNEAIFKEELERLWQASKDVGL